MYVVKEKSDRYEAVDTLADGAMGTVVLARDRLLDRMVAIKTVKLRGGDDLGRRQRLRDALLREARAVQLLAHPNIVTVYDVVGDGPGQPPSLVMEYVEGNALEALLKGTQPLPVEFAVGVALQISEALDHAHSMGVIHGDIKPSNILITHDQERVKLVDFGISQLLGVERRADRRPFGTPRYVSPEQLHGQEADPRSDLFSLGVVLYEMLTGRSPFGGTTASEVAREVARGAADLSPSTLGRVPRHLQAVLRKALEKDPSLRYQSALEMAKAITDPDSIRSLEDAVATQDLTGLVEVKPRESRKEATPAPAAPSVRSPSTAPGRGFYKAVPESRPVRWRLAWVAVGALALGILLSLLVLQLFSPGESLDARFSSEHQLRRRVFPLLREGQRLLLAGEPEVAARLFQRAEELAPNHVAITRLRRRAEQEALALEVYREAAEETDPPVLAEAAATTPRQQVESSPPALRSPARPRRAPVPSKQRAVESPSPRARTVEPVVADKAFETEPQPPSEVATRLPPPAWTPSTIADLRIDVFSYLSRGVLTVYAGQEQILLEPFRFVKRRGLLRRKGSAGRIETSVRLPAGSTEFRIYVATDGRETETVNLSAELAGGQTHVLRLIIAENGSTAAQLN